MQHDGPSLVAAASCRAASPPLKKKRKARPHATGRRIAGACVSGRPASRLPILSGNGRKCELDERAMGVWHRMQSAPKFAGARSVSRTSRVEQIRYIDHRVSHRDTQLTLNAIRMGGLCWQPSTASNKGWFSSWRSRDAEIEYRSKINAVIYAFSHATTRLAPCPPPISTPTVVFRNLCYSQGAAL